MMLGLVTLYTKRKINKEETVVMTTSDPIKTWLQSYRFYETLSILSGKKKCMHVFACACKSLYNSDFRMTHKYSYERKGGFEYVR